MKKIVFYDGTSLEVDDVSTFNMIQKTFDNFKTLSTFLSKFTKDSLSTYHFENEDISWSSQNYYDGMVIETKIANDNKTVQIYIGTMSEIDKIKDQLEAAEAAIDYLLMKEG